jgi:hypothetical protein
LDEDVSQHCHGHAEAINLIVAVHQALGLTAQVELKEIVESSLSLCISKRVVTGAFIMSFIGSTCTGLPGRPR